VTRTAFIYLAGISLGITVALWTASMQVTCPAFCMFGLPRFAPMECVLMGALILVGVLTVALAVDQDLPSETAQGYRTITRCSRTVVHFLFEDLSRQREH
jgi:hypothetical protein